MVGRFGRRAALRTVVVVALAVVVDPISAVQAQNVPTDREVERARDAGQRADEAVADARGRLDGLAAELDDARVRAASAVEAYDGAHVELARARRAEEAAVAEAAVVRDERAAADVELGRLAAAAYRSGGGLSELGVVVNIVTDASIVDVSDALAAVSAVRGAERRVAQRTAAEQAQRRRAEDEAHAEPQVAPSPADDDGSDGSVYGRVAA